MLTRVGKGVRMVKLTTLQQARASRVEYIARWLATCTASHQECPCCCSCAWRSTSTACSSLSPRKPGSPPLFAVVRVQFSAKLARFHRFSKCRLETLAPEGPSPQAQKPPFPRAPQQRPEGEGRVDLHPAQLSLLAAAKVVRSSCHSFYLQSAPRNRTRYTAAVTHSFCHLGSCALEVSN